jgi:hypothetical protein
MERSWEYTDRSQTHECGNWTEAAQFLFCEYINRNFFAVRVLAIRAITVPEN